MRVWAEFWARGGSTNGSVMEDEDTENPLVDCSVCGKTHKLWQVCFDRECGQWHVAFLECPAILPLWVREDEERKKRKWMRRQGLWAGIGQITATLLGGLVLVFLLKLVAQLAGCDVSSEWWEI